MTKRFVRPPVVVLGTDALVPEANRAPEPTTFTHMIRTSARFRLTATTDGPFEGRLRAGARVALIARTATGRCRVVDEHGVSVFVACSALRRMSPAE